jgi:hypothetical protein
VRARDYWRTVTVDRVDFLDQFVAVLRDADVRYCVVGGQAVNAYVDPVVSLDLDLVVALADLRRLEPALSQRFQIERFPHSLNLSMPGSDLRVQLQTDPRYEVFIERSSPRDILGVSFPVARVEDVLQGKIWAVSDETRRGSKRQKDLADIARLLEAFPHLREAIPIEIQRRLL